MTGRMTILLVAGLADILLSGTPPLPAQEPIRVNVDLSQVEVVVTDKHGQRVTGLNRDDFQLFIDRKEKSITHFSFIDSGKQAVRSESPQSIGRPRREEVNRTIVFMLDEVHTAPDNLVRLAPIMRRFADEQVRPGDLVSVMTVRTNMGIYERFTSDPRRIHAAVERLVRIVGQHYDQINSQVHSDYDYFGKVDASSAVFMETYHALTMASLARAIEGLKGMPGRKAIVLFTDGIEHPMSQLTPQIGINTDPEILSRMEARIQKVVDLANRNGVVFYCFDAKQLSTPGDDGLTPARRYSLMADSFFLTKETGGFFIHDTDSLNEGLAKAMDEMSGYYLLGYSPTEEEIAKKKRDGRPHQIRVKVRRPGMNVRSRTGISLSPDEETPVSKTSETPLQRALFSPFAGGEIGMRLSPVYSAAPPDSKTGARRSMLRALISVDTSELIAQAGRDKKVTLEVAAVAFDADSKVVANRGHRQTFDLSAIPAGSSIDYRLDIAIPRPGPFEIRAAVREEGSGALGSAGVFVDVPDFNKARLSLSSLVLSETDSKDRAAEVNIASRRFQIGHRVNYGFQVYGARIPEAGGAPQLDMELRLFREGAEVFASKAIPIAADPGEKEVTVVGSFVVPANFVEGEYTVQVTARDRHVTSGTGASQWTDLTLSR